MMMMMLMLLLMMKMMVMLLPKMMTMTRLLLIMTTDDEGDHKDEKQSTKAKGTWECVKHASTRREKLAAMSRVVRSSKTILTLPEVKAVKRP
jgi:hypothetical protein